MIIRKCENGTSIEWSGADTHAWANRPGAAWPCAVCNGRALRVTLAANGDLEDIQFFDDDGGPVDGPNVPANELNAMIADALAGGAA